MAKRLAEQAATSLDDVRKRIRDAGLRCTAARIWVLKYLLEARGPQSHAEVSDALAPQGFDRATIYRNLVEMAEVGMLSRVELGDHVWRFEYRKGDGHGLEHPHFVCIDCGGVSCLSSVTVSIKPVPGTKATVIGDITEVLLRGHCGHCEK